MGCSGTLKNEYWDFGKGLERVDEQQNGYKASEERINFEKVEDKEEKSAGVFT